jgi:outer membrane protein assembly factor BamB
MTDPGVADGSDRRPALAADGTDTGDEPGTVSRRSLLAGAAGAAGLAATAGCTTLADAIAPSDDQPAAATAQFRAGLHRRGFRPDVRVPDSVSVAWSLPVNTADHTAAKASFVHVPASAVREATGDAGAGDRLIVPGDDGVVRALTAGGEVVWEAATEPSTRGIHGTPAVADGRVFVGAYDGALYAFDLGDGTRLWRRKVGDAIGSSPGYHDGTVFIAVEYYTPSGGVFALDAESGATQWSDRRVTNHPHSTAAISREHGKLVVGDNDGFLYGWDYPELSFAWRFPAERPAEEPVAIKGPVATYDGGAYFGSWDSRVYRVDLETGGQDWAFETGSYVMSGPAVDPERGVVYIGSHDGNCYALDAGTGTEIWRYGTGSRIVGCPTATRERVVFGSKDQSCYAVAAADGAEVWSMEFDGWMTSTPLVTDRGVYVAERAPQGADGPAGHAYALRPE